MAVLSHEEWDVKLLLFDMLFDILAAANDKKQILLDRWCSPNKNTPVENQTQCL